jgi:alpha-beta hydrolase superfamily lysophospholipase
MRNRRCSLRQRWAVQINEMPCGALTRQYGLPSSQHSSPGVRVHYTDEGNREGRTLILVHGFAASVHAWRPWAERLSADFRIVAIDLPGHGLTQTPDGYRATLTSNAALIDALANAIGVRSFVLRKFDGRNRVAGLRDDAWRQA